MKFRDVFDMLKQETFDAMTDEELLSVQGWIELKKNIGRDVAGREPVMNEKNMCGSTTHASCGTTTISPLL